MKNRWLVTLLAECGMRVAACAVVENDHLVADRFRCIRGMALNASHGVRWGDR